MAGVIHSVAGVVCPVPGVMYTVLGEIHSVAGVVCPVSGVIYIVLTVLGEIHSMAGVAWGLHCVAEESHI